MMHWRKSISERAGLGGLSTDAPATLGSYAPSDSNSLSLQPVLHRQNISHPPLNIGSVIRDVILGTIAGVALLASVFIVLFVRA
jgi:hypothetical protein